jgi:hypothetical protein
MKKDEVPDLAAVREDLDRWRSAHSPRQSIPDEFWAKAVALLEHHSPTTVCRALRLNSSRLRERAGSAAPPRRRGRPPKPRPTTPATTSSQTRSSTSFLVTRRRADLTRGCRGVSATQRAAARMGRYDAVISSSRR